jgi:hypothetical protein
MTAQSNSTETAQAPYGITHTYKYIPNTFLNVYVLNQCVCMVEPQTQVSGKHPTQKFLPRLGL